jgi:hypothetical protein
MAMIKLSKKINKKTPRPTAGLGVHQCQLVQTNLTACFGQATTGPTIAVEDLSWKSDLNPNAAAILPFSPFLYCTGNFR